MTLETFIWIVSALLRYMRKNIFTPKCSRRSSELAFSHAANNVQLQLWTSAISGNKVETNSSFGSENNRSPEMCTGLKVRVISLWMSILGLFLVNNLLLTILQKLYYFSNTSNLEKKRICWLTAFLLLRLRITQCYYLLALAACSAST